MFKLFYYTTIGTVLDTTGLICAGVGIGVVFGTLILGVARNSSLREQLFSYAILGFAFFRSYWIIRFDDGFFATLCVITMRAYRVFFFMLNNINIFVLAR